MSQDIKYVLLPRIEERRRTPKFQPWYRERVRMKYPCHVDTKNWKFVKDGLDDFRDGLPPPHDDIMIEPEKGPSPVVLSETRRVKSNVSNVRHRLTDRQIYLSRELPTAEKRRQLIDSYISALLDHPMALFPHFNENLPGDLYNKLTKLFEAELLRVTTEEQDAVNNEDQDGLTTRSEIHPVLDEENFSDKNSNTHSSVTDDKSQYDVEETKVSSTRFRRSTVVYDESGKAVDSEELERKQKNPYRWFIEQQKKKQQAKGPTKEEEATTAMETRLRSVSEDFCNWLGGFGEGTNLDVDPAVVRNLFSTAYDTKPSLSVPIKIVEMTRIPPELREGAQETMMPTSARRKTTFPELQVTPSVAKSQQFTRSYGRESQARNYRYGAWYLPKSLWHHSLKTQELQDPKVLQAEREDPMRQQEEQMNSYLAPLHGIDAFKEYLVENNAPRLPKLITDVEKYRRDNPRELANASKESELKKTLI